MTQRGAGRGARALPDGFAVRLSGRVRSHDEGRTLVGGTRAGVLFLSATATGLLAAGGASQAGAPQGGAGTLVVRDAVSGALARRLLNAGMADPVWETPLPPVRDVTVVIPVRDRAFPLDRLLRTVEQLDPGTPVVVVDDGSADPGALEVVADRHGARLVRHPVNRGPAAARNTGLREVATAYVAFCDSDVVPTGGWLRRLRRHFEDPAVGLVAPRVLGMEPAPSDGALARYEQVRSSLDLGPVAGSVRAATPISYVPSACLAGRVAALGSGFDETLRVAEDVDLVWRLVEDGWTVRYEPEAVVRHDHRTELRAWLARKAYYGTGAAPLARRHGDAVAPMVLAPWSALACAALLAQRRWSVPVALGVTTIAAARLRSRLSRSPHPGRLATDLAVRGGVAAVQQTGAALVRHHWPLAVAAALVSARARRALLLAALLDGAREPARAESGLSLPVWLLLRRLDDLAYGAGVWRGALGDSSVAALMPRLVLSRRGQSPPSGATAEPETSQTQTGSGPPRSGWM